MTKWAAVALAAAAPLAAAKLTPATLEGFERYVQENDARVEAELRNGPFLWIDSQPGARRPILLEQLRRGEILVEEIKRPGARVSDGRIHHWIGLTFVTGVNLKQTEVLVSDYDNYQKIHQPYIQRSRLLRRETDITRIYLRLYRKKGLTAVMDTEHEVRYTVLSATRAHSRSHTTLVAEVENPGSAEERRRPPGDDRGFLWRHISYWRFLEQDGGTYIQCEALSLSRETGAGVGWLIGYFLNGAHREFLVNMVSGTRAALAGRR